MGDGMSTLPLPSRRRRGVKRPVLRSLCVSDHSPSSAPRLILQASSSSGVSNLTFASVI